MIEYKLIKTNDSALKVLGKEGWQLLCINEGKMYFSREVKKTKEEKKIEKEESPEFEEFVKLYRTINNNGSYDIRLPKKYNGIIKNISHESIMNNLNQYITHLKVHKDKPALQCATYLNQNRFLDKWNLVSNEVSTKWQDDIINEYNLEYEVIENIKTEISSREAKNKPREISAGILRNIIKYVTTGEI